MKKSKEHSEEHWVSEANKYWYELLSIGEPNIIILNQYI